MANNENTSGNYGSSSLFRMFSDLMSQPRSASMLANIAGMPAEDVADYDSVAATVSMMQDSFFKDYMYSMAGETVARRMAALNAYANPKGKGEKPGVVKDSNLLKFMRTIGKIDPSYQFSLLGHFQAPEALSSIIASSGNIGYARGGNAGGVLRPRQRYDNMLYAASQGSMAYRNNFDFDGSVDVNQTHGLSLPQATLLSNRTLSDRSQYETWAERIRRRDPKELDKSEMAIPDLDVERFRTGVGATTATSESFNKQIKNFTEQINRFVASVSKMTGNFDEAVNFIQNMTGGKLFSSERGASEARERASRAAFALRVAAADAQEDPRVLYNQAKLFGLGANIAAGYDYRSMMQNTSTTAATLGMQSAIGFAKWRQLNPNATEDEQVRAKMSFEDRQIGYLGGDMHKMNVLAASLVDMGLMRKDEVENLVREGDADKMFKQLSKVYGGPERVRQFLGDAKNIEYTRLRHQSMTNDFDTIGISSAMDNESIRVGIRNLFSHDIREFATLQKTERDNQITAMEKGMRPEDTRRSIATSDTALEKVGVKDAAARERIRKIASNPAATREDIITEIQRAGGNTTELEKYTKAEFAQRVAAHYGTNSKEAAVLGLPEQAYEIQRDAEKIHKESLLSTSALKAAGLDDNAIQLIQDQAKQKENSWWTADTIRTKVRDNFKGNVDRLDTVGYGMTLDALEGKYGTDSVAMQNLRSSVTSQMGDVSSAGRDKSRREAYEDTVYASRARELEDAQVALLTSSGNEEKRLAAQKNLRSLVSKGLRGQGGFDFSNRSYLENLFNDAIAPNTVSGDVRNAVVQRAVAIYQDAIAQGKSPDAAFAEVLKEGALKDENGNDLRDEKNRKVYVGASFKPGVKIKGSERLDYTQANGFASYASREAAYDKTIRNSLMPVVLREINGNGEGMLNLGLTDEQLKKVLPAAFEKFDKLRAEHTDWTDERLMVQAAIDAFSDETVAGEGKSIGRQNKAGAAVDLVSDATNGTGTLYKAIQREVSRTGLYGLQASRAGVARDMKHQWAALDRKRAQAVSEPVENILASLLNSKDGKLSKEDRLKFSGLASKFHNEQGMSFVDSAVMAAVGILPENEAEKSIRESAATRETEAENDVFASIEKARGGEKLDGKTRKAVRDRAEALRKQKGLTTGASLLAAATEKNLIPETAAEEAVKKAAAQADTNVEDSVFAQIAAANNGKGLDEGQQQKLRDAAAEMRKKRGMTLGESLAAAAQKYLPESQAQKALAEIAKSTDSGTEKSVFDSLKDSGHELTEGQQKEVRQKARDLRKKNGMLTGESLVEALKEVVPELNTSKGVREAAQQADSRVETAVFDSLKKARNETTLGTGVADAIREKAAAYRKQGMSQSESWSKAASSYLPDDKARAALREAAQKADTEFITGDGKTGETDVLQNMLERDKHNSVLDAFIGEYEKQTGGPMSETDRKKLQSELHENFTEIQKEGKIQGSDQYKQAVLKTFGARGAKDKEVADAMTTGSAFQETIDTGVTSFTKNAGATVRNYELKKLGTKAGMAAFGMAAGGNSGEAFYNNAGISVSSGGMQEARELMYSDLGSLIVGGSDDKSAQEHNRTIGKLRGFSAKEIERRTKASEKAEKVASLEQELMAPGSGYVFNPAGKTPEERRGNLAQLSKSLKDFDEKNGSLSDEKYLDALKGTSFGKGNLGKKIQDFAAKTGMSVKEVIRTIAAGGGTDRTAEGFSKLSEGFLKIGDFNGAAEGNGSREDLANAFTAFDVENAGKVDNDTYRKNFETRFGAKGKELADQLQTFATNNGMSFQEAVQGVGAGEGYRGTRFEREKEGFLKEHISGGATELSRDPVMAKFLEELVQITRNIAQSVGPKS